MAESPPATPSEPTAPRKRANTAASVTQSIASFTEDLVLHRDPAPGFFAATAQATSKAPTLAEIRRGSFGEGGWERQQRAAAGVVKRSSGSGGGSWDRKRSWSGKGGSRDSGKLGEGKDGQGGELFAPLTEEPGRISEDRRRGEVDESRGLDEGESSREKRLQDGKAGEQRAAGAHGPTHPQVAKHDTSHAEAIARMHSSGYIPPPQLPWTTSTAIALKGFWRWFITPFGFLVTLYGLNVVAWGGMLFLLLCGAAPGMCHSPIPTEDNRRKMSPAAALNLPGPYYYNCNDINSPRRVWIEIDSQILNALFCVTGFGLVPWRFRDLYYILRYRFARTKKQGVEGKMYGLRVLAGIHRGWFRLPGSETLDAVSSREYIAQLSKTTTTTTTTTSTSSPSDLESASSIPTNDIRLPFPVTKSPSPPATSIRAPATKLWLMDFFIWCQVWNTFFQCCLCGFMWGQDRYERPSWSTGLFVALACIIAGVGGVVSFVEGRKVKRVEGMAPAGAVVGGEGAGGGGGGMEMGQGEEAGVGAARRKSWSKSRGEMGRVESVHEDGTGRGGLFSWG